jgi:sulfite reductase (NADPH) flavoprotein alpha-component
MLNGEGSAKETIHLEFNLEGSGLTYEAGDALAVIPHNADEVVNEIIATNKLDANAPVLIKEQEYTLRDALTSQLDVTAISLPVLKRWNEIAKDAKLEKMLLPENKSELQDYLYGREIIDVLHDFPAKEVTADALVGIMRKLPPRLYSIASSPKAHPGEVHLTVGVVRYDAHGRKRKGVCSTYLADRIVEGGKADVFVTPNKHFKIPANNDAPMIMVGPGTGIAPFRAFVEERKEIGAKGKNWLFFGDQHYLTDFLYQTEWQDYLADGILTKLDVAFSRDQKDKVYVQDRMRENSKELYQWLEQGASFYVCGDASRMATDVDVALHDIVEKEGGLSKDDAAAYVKKLKDDKRYLRDVY